MKTSPRHAIVWPVVIVCCLASVPGALAQPHQLSPEVQHLIEEARELSAKGQYNEAETRVGQALAIQEAALGQNHPDVATSLTALGKIHAAQGSNTSAERLFKKALAIREATLGKMHPNVAESLDQLSVIRTSQGHYAEAESGFLRALHIQKSALGSLNSSVATTLGHLAVLYSKQRRYSKAEHLFNQSLHVQELVLGPSHILVADTLNDLADLHSHRGLYDKAQPLYEKALSIREAALGVYHPDIIKSLYGLAYAYKQQGIYSEAELLLERALSIEEKLNLANRSDTRGVLHFATHGYFFPHGSPSSPYLPYLGQPLLNSGLISPRSYAEDLLAKGHGLQELPLLALALLVSEEHLRQNLLVNAETDLTNMLRLIGQNEERLFILLGDQLENEAACRLALSSVLLNKGRSLDELADTSRRISRSLKPDDRELFKRLRDLRKKLSEQVLAGRGHFTPAMMHEFKELAAQGNTLESELAKRSIPLQEAHSLPSPEEIVNRVAKVIPQGTALVEFVSYHEGLDHAAPSEPTSTRESSLRYLALVLLPDGHVHAVALGSASLIDGAIERLHVAVSNQSEGFQPIAQELYTLLLYPLTHLLGQVRHLYIAPDSQIALVPFAALHDGKGFLVDSFEFTYVTSGKDLLPVAEKSPPTSSVVVIANPNFGTFPGTDHPSAGTYSQQERGETPLERLVTQYPSGEHRFWEALPGTLVEAKTIQHLFPQLSMLLEHNATKEAFLGLNRPGLLHIATHGFSFNEAFFSIGRFTEEPLLRYGLVFAGANVNQTYPGLGSTSSSLATALEVMGMDLWGTQLVVLSACSTGLGEVTQGQGLYGLRRALRVAGAQTVVSSLWNLNDETTAEFMEAFYRHLLAHEGRVKALHSAMHEFRLRHAHPYFWAPFIATGQGTPLSLAVH